MAPLPNYLRSNRKRLSLTQEEMTFLLGTRSGSKVNRHERFVREPGLETAIGYGVILAKSVEELFAGMQVRIAKEIGMRAKVLAQRVRKGKQTPSTARKLLFLINLAEKAATHSAKRQ